MEKEIFKVFKAFLLKKSFDNCLLKPYYLEDIDFEKETGVSINKIYDILYDYVYADFDEYAYDWIDGYEDVIGFTGKGWINLSNYEQQNLINAITEGYYLCKNDQYREIGGIKNIKNFKQFVYYVDCSLFLDKIDIEEIVEKNYDKIEDRFDFDDDED